MDRSSLGTKSIYHCVKKNQAFREKITGRGEWMIPEHHATKERSEVEKDEMGKRRRSRSVFYFVNGIFGCLPDLVPMLSQKLMQSCTYGKRWKRRLVWLGHFLIDPECAATAV